MSLKATLIPLLLAAAAIAPLVSAQAAEVAEWTAKFNKGVTDMPVNAAMLANPDYSQDIVRCTDPNVFAVTFDDGPGDGTIRLLDELKKRNVKVTFFVVGGQVLKFPTTVKRAYDDGHQIAIHTMTHHALTTLSTPRVIAELVGTALVIKNVIGVTPKHYRPPYGDIDNRVRSISKSLGMSPIIWSDDSGDSAGSTTVVQNMAGFALGPKRGPITLQHDLDAAQAGYGPGAVDAVLAGGYKIVRMDECVGVPAYDESIWAGLPANGITAPLASASANVTSATSATTTRATVAAPAKATATAGATVVTGGSSGSGIGANGNITRVNNGVIAHIQGPATQLVMALVALFIAAASVL
ncbi:hypothetical protein BC831DRAFT_476956 [Entophlyctis helioformis]|nr:hypothetical protein BC831DRAFT_476956 [Entophlyctis helioformis]